VGQDPADGAGQKGVHRGEGKKNENQKPDQEMPKKRSTKTGVAAFEGKKREKTLKMGKMYQGKKRPTAIFKRKNYTDGQKKGETKNVRQSTTGTTGNTESGKLQLPWGKIKSDGPRIKGSPPRAFQKPETQKKSHRRRARADV